MRQGRPSGTGVWPASRFRPQSRLQKYRLTAKGRAWLAQNSSLRHIKLILWRKVDNAPLYVAQADQTGHRIESCSCSPSPTHSTCGALAAQAGAEGWTMPRWIVGSTAYS